MRSRRHSELAPDFFERSTVAIDQPKTLFEHLTLAIGQRLENVFNLFPSRGRLPSCRSGIGALVLDEIAEIRFLAFAYGA